METGIVITGLSGTWRSIDTIRSENSEFYIVESEQYGDQAENLVIDRNGHMIAFADDPNLQGLMLASAKAEPNEYNPNRDAEIAEEDNYDMIDSLPNNGFGEKEKKQQEKEQEQQIKEAIDSDEAKTSVLARLHEYQRRIAERDIRRPLDRDRENCAEAKNETVDCMDAFAET